MCNLSFNDLALILGGCHVIHLSYSLRFGKFFGINELKVLILIKEFVLIHDKWSKQMWSR